jgi:FG-GAP-like repeat
MNKRLLATLGLFCAPALCSAGEFERPVRLKADGVAIRVESPGYAAPCWADVDGDGKKDLLVGQFNKGKIRLFKNLGNGKLAAGVWLKAEGQVAEVPGVW